MSIELTCKAEPELQGEGRLGTGCEFEALTCDLGACRSQSAGHQACCSVGSTCTHGCRPSASAGEEPLLGSCFRGCLG